MPREYWRRSQGSLLMKGLIWNILSFPDEGFTAPWYLAFAYHSWTEPSSGIVTGWWWPSTQRWFPPGEVCNHTHKTCLTTYLYSHLKCCPFQNHDSLACQLKSGDISNAYPMLETWFDEFNDAMVTWHAFYKEISSFARKDKLLWYKQNCFPKTFSTLDNSFFFFTAELAWL